MYVRVVRSRARSYFFILVSKENRNLGKTKFIPASQRS